jgi:hypothetical protein
VSTNPKEGDSSRRMTGDVSGLYPDWPPSGNTFTILRELEMATGNPPAR